MCITVNNHQDERILTKGIMFTLVIPTHNGRTSVKRAAESVLNQTFTDFELIVVSDGEGSRTRDILRDISDPRLQVVEQQKRGVSAARNLGVSSGRHRWIAFLDDDDEKRPDALENMASCIREDTVAVTGQVAIWTGQHLDRVWQCHLSTSDPTMNASTILPGGFAVRRDMFEAVGGFDESLHYSENMDLGLRLCDHIQCTNAGRILHLPRILADFHREQADDRKRRYKSAPADAARILLARYSDRYKLDPQGTAALNRIISRDSRISNDSRSALRHALSALKSDPTSIQNFRSVALAALFGLPRLWRWPRDTTRSASPSPPSSTEFR